jgi:heme/copper-type cytochrome/quinol oxidase subunit 3
MYVGDVKLFDVDRDGRNDIEITLHGIANGNADLSFRQLKLAANSTNSTTFVMWWWIPYVVVAFAALLVIYLVTRKKRHETT